MRSVRAAFTLAAAAVLAASGPASAQAVFERPGLLTSSGQSSDVAIVKVLLNTQAKLGLDVKRAASTPIAQDEGPKVGDQAPAFTLPGSDGKTYSLADYRGVRPVVLAWFPRAFAKL